MNMVFTPVNSMLFQVYDMFSTILNIIVLLSALVILEIKDIRLIPILLFIQGVSFTLLIVLGGLGIHIFPFIFLSILLSPAIVYYVIGRVDLSESKPLISFKPSILLSLLLVISSAYIQLLISRSLDFNVIIVVIGVYGVIVKTDLRRIASCLSMILTSLHMFIEHFPLELNIIFTFSSSTFLILFAYFTLKFYLISGKISTRELRGLRF